MEVFLGSGTPDKFKICPRSSNEAKSRARISTLYHIPLYSSNAPISWMGRMGSGRGEGMRRVYIEGSKTWRVEVTCRAFMTRTFSFIPYNGAIENCLGDTCQCYGTITWTGRKQGGKSAAEIGARFDYSIPFSASRGYMLFFLNR